MMAPARKIPTLDCSAPLTEAARRIVNVRLDEVIDLRAAIKSAADVQELHDLRIGAKRLRYSLEMFDVCFPPKQADEYADRVRAMQDVLGRIHDLDVMHDLLSGRLSRMDDQARQRTLQLLGDPSAEPPSADELRKLARGDQNVNARLGVLHVMAAKLAERRTQYARFEELWSEWEQSSFLDAVRTMVEAAH